MNTKKIRYLIIKGIFTTLFGLLTAFLVRYFYLIQQDMSTSKFWLLASSEIIGVLFIVVFITNLVENRKSQTSQKRNLWILILGLVFIGTPLYIFCFLQKRPEPFPNEQFGILVADFKDTGQRGEGRSMKNNIINQLEYKFNRQIERAEVGVQGWTGMIAEDDSYMETIAKKQNADIIISGDVSIIGVSVTLFSKVAVKNELLRKEIKENPKFIKDYNINFIDVTLKLTKYVEVLYHLSNMFMKINRSDFVRAKAIVVDSLKSKIHNSMKHHFLGLVFYNQALITMEKDRNLLSPDSKFDSLFSLAESKFKETISIDHDYHNSYYNLGRLYMVRYRLSDNGFYLLEAVKMYEEAYKLRHKNPRYIITLSRAYLDAGMYKDVISMTEKTINSNTFYLFSDSLRNELKENQKTAEKASK